MLRSLPPSQPPRHKPSPRAASLLAALACALFIAPLASAQVCGDPKAGSCCSEQFGPSCSDADCCLAVCEVDNFCCSVQWDDLCAGMARKLCTNCTQAACGNPLAGSCCESSDTPGCQDAQCCAQVCAVDPYCCEQMWDFTCAEQALASCSACTITGDLNGDGVVNSADLSILLNAWGTPDADLNGDGTTGSQDLAVLLNNWS